MACGLPARTAIDHYHFLPYRPRFRAIVPMLAFLSEQHIVGSDVFPPLDGHRAQVTALLVILYPLRELSKLQSVRTVMARRASTLPDHGDWRPLPSAMRVVRMRQLVH